MKQCVERKDIHFFLYECKHTENNDNRKNIVVNIAESEQSSHTPGRSHQRYVETIL